MTRTPWFPGTTHPARRGWYERDHRLCNYLDPADRRITLDLWEPVADRRSILYPGVWYVQDGGLNDASHQNLPWRGLASPAPYVRPDKTPPKLTGGRGAGKCLF